jgi:hypothetical protein
VPGDRAQVAAEKIVGALEEIGGLGKFGDDVAAFLASSGAKSREPIAKIRHPERSVSAAEGSRCLTRS